MNSINYRTMFGVKGICFLAVLIAVPLAAAGHTRARNMQRTCDQRDEEDLPTAVLKTAERYAPEIKIESVRTREIEGHPKVYVIDGETGDRDVVLHITEDGAIQEARFHERPEGVKPTRQEHSAEELPNAVRETATRVFPAMEITEVKSHQSPHEVRTFHIVGKAVEDGKEREVVLVIEADGDLLEARVFKPRIVTAADDSDIESAKPKDKSGFDD
jgi:hypothetical protein